VKCLISKMAVVRTIVCCLIIGGSPAVAMAQFDYPVGQPDGAGWLGNRNGLWWLDQYDYGGGCLAYHPGIDLNKEGTAGDADRYEPVYAAAAGTVVAAARYGSTWGNIVVIEHTLGDGSRVWSLYGHLEDFTVAVNDDVSRRAQIGRVGKGDGSLAAHLHFEIRRISQPASAFPCNQTMSWVQDRYYDPVAFVSSHRAGTIEFSSKRHPRRTSIGCRTIGVIRCTPTPRSRLCRMPESPDGIGR
jgi:murein DD-endopeptidase MepM/ murein hydrolase activator NlpD